VTRRVAAVYFQLCVWHKDSRAGFDMVPPERPVIARVGDDCDISIPIGFEHVGKVGVGAPAARNRWIVRLHKGLEPLRNRWIDERPLPQIASHRASCHEKHQSAHQDRAEVFHRLTQNVRMLRVDSCSTPAIGSGGRVP
jgi:hypothetical protein